PPHPPPHTQTRDSVESLCNSVEDWSSGFVNWLSGDAIARASENCELAEEAIKDGRIDDAMAYTDETCDEVLDTIETSQEEDGNSLKRMQIVMLSMDLCSKARIAAELGISLMNALWAVKGMVPAAVAIAPALLRGALTVKTLVPQSSVPGMFIIILPFLYCPLVWCIYNVAFQLTGTLVFFFGLLLLAFAPMSYVVLGMAMHITKPMDDQAIKRVMAAMSNLNLSLMAVAGGLCLFFTFGQDHDHRALAKRGIEAYLKSPMAITNLFVTTLWKYLITTLAGVDFVVREIATQRDFEVFLETGEDRTSRGFENSHKGMLGGESKHRIVHMLKQRTARLDDMCKASRKRRKGAPGEGCGGCLGGGRDGATGGAAGRQEMSLMSNTNKASNTKTVKMHGGKRATGGGGRQTTNYL
ncbi:hypothetical protein TeGR_g15104, partial [Tetraparma gracilis]